MKFLPIISSTAFFCSLFLGAMDNTQKPEATKNMQDSPRQNAQKNVLLGTIADTTNNNQILKNGASNKGDEQQWSALVYVDSPCGPGRVVSFIDPPYINLSSLSKGSGSSHHCCQEFYK